MHIRSKGFTILELMIVVAIIAIIASIAIPSLMNARKAGNESSAIASLRTIATVMAQYRTRMGTRPDNAQRLVEAGYIAGFGGGPSLRKAGYRFNYLASGPILWAFRANPVNVGVTGDRYFWIDYSGVIRFSSVGPASQSDAPLD